MATGSAVAGIEAQEGADAVAAGGAGDTVVDARAGDARDGFVGRRCGTHSSAASAVVEVGGEIDATTAATGLSQSVAVISAGPAVRVMQQVAAHPAASGGRAADVFSARSADAAGVPVARLTSRQALRLLLRRATFAEGFARVPAAGPSGSHPQRAQHRTGEDGAQPAQRFAARHRLRQRLGELIE